MKSEFIIKALAENKFIWPKIDQKYDELRKHIQVTQITKTNSILNELPPEALSKAVKLLIIMEVDKNNGIIFVGDLFEKTFKREISFCEDNLDNLNYEHFIQTFCKAEYSMSQFYTLTYVYLHIRKILGLPDDKSPQLEGLLSSKEDIDNIEINLSEEDLAAAKKWLRTTDYPCSLGNLSLNEKVYNNELRIFEYITRPERIPMRSYENFIFSRRDLVDIAALAHFYSTGSSIIKDYNAAISLFFMFKSLAKYAEQCKNDYIDLALSQSISANASLKSEISRLEAKLTELKSLQNEKQQQLNALQLKYDKLQNEYTKTKEILHEQSLFIDQLQKTDVLNEISEDVSEDNSNINLADYNFVIIGGHITWRNKISTLLPNAVIISPDKVNFDPNILKNADLIIFNFQYSSHSIFYKLQQNCDKEKILYVNATNTDRLLSQIKQKIKTSE